jgi:hypothetical protein
MLDFTCFNPSACGYGPAVVPMLPATGTGWPGWRAAPSAHLAQPHHWHVRARYALHAALELAQVGPDGGLLCPALHCLSMLDGAMALGAPVSLYRVHADLSPDLADLAQRLGQLRPRPRAVLASHFFGRPQDLTALRDWCDREALLLIEDCAHVLVRPDGSVPAGQDPRLGKWGDWAVASPAKFYPIAEGGVLWTTRRSLGDVPHPAPAADELRALLRTLRDGLARPVQVPTDSAAAAGASASPTAMGADRREQRGEPSHAYRAAWANRAGLRVCAWTARRADTDRIAQLRRARYLALLRLLQDTAPGSRQAWPVWNDWPESATPYMLPLWLARPAEQFHQLKRAGVPVSRWDEMADSDCPLATHARLGMIFLPCHQTLSEAQFAWLCGTVRRALSL